MCVRAGVCAGVRVWFSSRTQACVWCRRVCWAAEHHQHVCVATAVARSGGEDGRSAWLG